MTSDLWAIVIVVASLLVMAAVLLWLGRFEGPDDDSDDDSGRGGGRGGPSPGPPPPPAPTWWADFEREFALYVAGSRRRRRPLASGRSRS
jgi:hypothetical protein